MNPGPPALYQLKTERTYIHGTNRNVRWWTYGQKDRNKQNKVILMVGETGSGKTTLINTMINHLLGVTFEDQEFYQITEEDEEDRDETQTQTSEITVYEAFVEENPTSLTIIDTPGYGDTGGFEKDREISEYLSRLFSDKDGIGYIDAVCFVMKASQNRLSGKELYIFHSVLSLFGRDIENNIVFLLTQSNGQRPTDALRVIRKAQIPCRRDGKKQPVHYLFNNQQKEKRDEEYSCVLKSSWEMGERSMKEFFTLMEEKNRKSVKMTLDVLKERRRLEACVSNLKGRISEEEFKMKNLTEIQEAIKENRDKIEKCEKFQFTVQTAVKEKVPNVNEWFWNRNVTCCSVCEENCHEWSCWWLNEPLTCSVMKNDHCTVCTGKCHYSKHVRENKKYVLETKTVTMTFKELKQEYERTGKKPKTRYDKKIFGNITKEHERNMKESENKSKIEEKLIRDLEKIKHEKFLLLHEAYKTIMSLAEIALKDDSAFTLHHLELLIPRLKEEGKDEWVKNLEDLRKAGEEKKNKGALQHVKDFTGQQWKQIDHCVTELEVFVSKMNISNSMREIFLNYISAQRGCIVLSKHMKKVTDVLLKDPGMQVIGVIMSLADAANNSINCSSWKKRLMTQLRQDIKAELEGFQDKITPMAEMMNDIQECTEKILNVQDAILIEDIADLTAQMSETICLVESETAAAGRFSIVLDMFSVCKNTSVLNDMNRLAETAIPEQIDKIFHANLVLQVVPIGTQAVTMMFHPVTEFCQVARITRQHALRSSPVSRFLSSYIKLQTLTNERQVYRGRAHPQKKI
ncbi:uncharacterized protein [Pseudorasbora parva]|uniref:uncharacterized protein n=1 Tax=Pseudorasbora parva TaxID=51549 RepID=UPI00351EED28